MILLFTLALVASAAPAPSSTGALVNAYQREIALLESEKSALALARDRANEKQRDLAATTSRSLAALDAELVSVRAKNDALAAGLTALERRTHDDGEALARETAALRAALVGEGVSVDGDLGAMLRQALEEIERGGAVRKLESGFFSADGTFVNGIVVDVGRVGMLGVFANGAGPLVRAADGVLQVEGHGHEEVTQKFVDGSGPLPLKVLDPPETQAQATDIEEAGVRAWAALLALLVVAAVAAGRVLLLWRIRHVGERALAQALARVDADDASGAVALCRSAFGVISALYARVIAASMRARVDLDDSAAEAYGEAAARVERVDRWLWASAGAALLLACSAALSIPAAMRVFAWTLAAAAPTALLLIASRAEMERVKRAMERGTLAIIDVARRARGGA